MSLLTNTKAMPRVKYCVMINAGCTFSGHFLALPYSMLVHSKDTLTIGEVVVRVSHQRKQVWNVPESWLVDLSEDVQDLSDTE